MELRGEYALKETLSLGLFDRWRATASCHETLDPPRVFAADWSHHRFEFHWVAYCLQESNTHFPPPIDYYPFASPVQLLS